MILLRALILLVIAGVWPMMAADKRPNIIVILTDDQRQDTLGVYNPDCPIPTPHIDRLAQLGVRFDNAFVTTPICAVSRSSILSGRYSSNSRHHQFETELPEDVFEDTYPMHLKRAGYFVGQLGKYGVGIRPDQKKRFDVFAAQEGQGPAFRNYRGKKLHDAEWLTVKTAEFLDQVPDGQPFCVQINYKEPHSSSVPAPEDDALLDNHIFERKATDTPEQFSQLPKYVRQGFGRVVYQLEFNPKKDHNPYLRQYFEKIASLDRSVGAIMKMLEERGLRENTIILYLSDHGTHLGEKQLAGKWTPYDPSLRIPFLVRDPRPQALKGAVLEQLVLNLDVAPTILSLAGLKVPETMDGRSLVPLLDGKKVDWRLSFFFEHFCSPAPVKYIPRNVGVRTADAKFVCWIDLDPAPEEYYDLASDPLEAKNLIAKPAHQEAVAQLRRAYEKWREATPSSYSFDSYGRRAQYGAKEIDWEKFKAARPKVYAAIEKQIKKMGVTWEQAVEDWETRYAICSKVGYWY